jgi:uncharacterized membrane protein
MPARETHQPDIWHNALRTVYGGGDGDFRLWLHRDEVDGWLLHLRDSSYRDHEWPGVDPADTEALERLADALPPDDRETARGYLGAASRTFLRVEQEAAQPYTTSLAELVRNPGLLAPPPAIAPRLAWRQRVTLLAAREKLGKSTYATAAAAAVSAGSPFLGEPTQAGKVLWIGTDEAYGDAVRRFMSFGANPENIHLLTRRPPAEEIVAVVRAEVGRLRPVKVVIDTLPTFVSGLVTDYNDATGYTPIMNALASIARDFDCALVVIHHARKDGEQYRDSTAIGAGVDMILMMTGKADESKRNIVALGRFPLDNYSVRLDGTRYLLAGSGEDTLEIRVLDCLRRNPQGQSTSAVAGQVGGNKQQVQRTLEHLQFTGLAFDAGSSNAHLWKLAAVEPDPMLLPLPEPE